MKKVLFILLVLTFAGLLILTNGRDEAEGKSHTKADAAPLSDEPIADYQSALLRLAFDTASAIPTNPHLRERCKSQEAAAYAAMELKQPSLALGYVKQIADWRRGSAYAELAYDLVKRGVDHDVTPYLDAAEVVAAAPQVEDWRKSRIRARIATVHAMLGDLQEARRIERKTGMEDQGKVAATQAKLDTDATFDDRVKELNQLVASKQFDPLQNAIGGYANLFDRFYDDAARRDAALERVKKGSSTLPGSIRVRIMLDMARTAVAHDDRTTALALVNDTQELYRKYAWPPEEGIPVLARIIEVRFLAGDAAGAREQLAALRAQFDTDRDRIQSFDRGAALRPIAETFAAIGDAEGARAAYRLAVEEGAINPNARPRAIDLCATCLSMAVHHFEPDASLWSRLREIQSGLEEPW